MFDVSVGLVIAIVSIVYFIIRIVDYLIRKKNDKEIMNKLSGLDRRLELVDKQLLVSQNNHANIIEKENTVLTKIETIDKTVSKTWDLHDTYDNDGVPIWWIPRSWNETQEKVVEICREISETQRAIAGTLERIENKSKT